MINIGDRRELFLDHHLTERHEGTGLLLHHPVAREVVISHDEPWEGNTCYYHTVMRDGNLLRMYYRGSHWDECIRTMTHEVVCYAESRDGIHWEKPELGLFDFNGSSRNNIVWSGGIGCHNFVPFRDWNPENGPESRYRAVGRKGKEGLFAFRSADGLHWSLQDSKPIITEGAFDSQNVAFWDGRRECYVEYHRGFREGIRDIMTTTSTDFSRWTEPKWLEYPGADPEHLYTNQIEPYPWAPHLYVGFPKRFVPGRNPERHAQDGVSDIVFMSSRDGVSFLRWTEAFIRPGLQRSRWVNRNNFVSYGLFETAPTLPGTPPEISILSAEDYYRGNGTRLRRYTIRRDGFVSLHASGAPGSCTTKPFVFSGGAFELNFSTSATGRLEIELLDESERAIEGVRFDPIYGDAVDAVVTPVEGSLESVSGTPVRLRITLRDGDLYSFRPVPREAGCRDGATGGVAAYG